MMSESKINPHGTQGARRTRAYKRSLSGCRECKARKVKCDEIHPTCGNCFKHFKNPAPCTWDSSARWQSLPQSNESSGTLVRSRTASLSRTPSMGQSTPIALTPLRSTFPLRLFHHYTTIISQELPQSHNPSVKAMWTVDAPQLAFDCDYLLNGILAVSAMHIYLFRSPDDRGLRRAIRVYFDRSITSFQRALPTLGSANALQIYLTAVFLATLAKAASTPDSSEPQLYELPLFTFKLFKSLAPLIVRAEKWLLQTNAAPFIRPLNYVSGAENLPLYRFIEENERPDLYAIIAGVDMASPDRDAYVGSISLSNAAIDLIVKGTSLPTLLRNYTLFVMLMSDGFMALLEKYDPRAMIIMGHHIALSSCMDTYWWASIGSKKEVYGIAGLLPEEWKHFMKWPLSFITNPPTGWVVQSTPVFDLDTELGNFKEES